MNVATGASLAVWPLAADFIASAAAVGSRLVLPVLLPDASLQDRSAFSMLLCVDNSGWFIAQGKSRIQVDFVSGANHHRRLHGGGRGQLLAKAIGLKSGNKIPFVLDATAGLGRDAFVLATLGCPVHLYERSGVVHQLLQDGLLRARATDDRAISDIVFRMQLDNDNAISVLSRLPPEKCPDVIYLDPMFPDRRKTAAVKKDMAVFHALLEGDGDADALLEIALEKAVCRVVVKRPRHAPCLAGKKPSITMEGESTRFDIYALRSLAIV